MDPFTSPEALAFVAMTRFLHRIAQEGAVELASFGLTPAKFQLLVQIRSRPGVAQWQLAEVAGVTKGNISQLVKKVEEAGFVLRVRNQGTDELAITDSGETLLAEVVPAHNAFMTRTFASLAADELETLCRLVGRLGPS